MKIRHLRNTFAVPAAVMNLPKQEVVILMDASTAGSDQASQASPALYNLYLSSLVDLRKLYRSFGPFISDLYLCPPILCSTLKTDSETSG